MNNITYFKKQAVYWGKRIGIGDIILIPFCDNTGSSAYAHRKGKEKGIMYNWRSVGKKNKTFINILIFHELAHLKHDYWYYGKGYGSFNNYDRAMCEYVAEKQALIWLKKYKPSYYKKYVKTIPKFLDRLLKYSWYRRFYFEAFSQIPEYSKHL